MTAGGPSTVLVTSRSFASASPAVERRLEEAGLTVRRGPPDHRLEALRHLLADAVAWIAGTGEISAAHLEAAPRLRVIARYGVGVDAVDLKGAAARGVRVTNTPGANSDSVADHTLALLLWLLRGGRTEERRANGPPTPRAREVGALTVGLVGLGQVGSAVAARLHGFGAEVLAHDPGLTGDAPAMAAHVQLCSLEDVIARSDVLSLHRPGGETLVDPALIERLRQGGLLVNTARADLVDEHAVADALQSGQLGGYATDVGASPGGPLTGAPNLVVTRHVGAHTMEAIERMGSMAVEEVLRALRGESAVHPVVAPPNERSGHL